MGCDIHVFAEKQIGEKWELVDITILGDRYDTTIFGDRYYGLFAFLAGVRNYSAITPISEPRGLPADISFDTDYWGADHSFSWLSVKELLEFNYDQPMENRRRHLGGGMFDGATVPEGEGIVTTYREFLGERFFKDLKQLKESGADRIVFGFDN